MMCSIPRHVLPSLSLTSFRTQENELQNLRAHLSRYCANVNQGDSSKSHGGFRPRVLLAQHNDASVVVYQAYQPSIAEYAVEHGHFGGPNFSFDRMSWIKPQFLWMMHRSNWATSKNQERVLALTLHRNLWDNMLKQAVFSSFQNDVHGSKENWLAQNCRNSEVVVQWDPMHEPFSGRPMQYRVIQVGLRGRILKECLGGSLLKIEDVTCFAHHISQEHRKACRSKNGLEANGDKPFDFLTPTESVYEVSPEVKERLGLS